MISIIVPAYNIESYIARALDSILAQTYTDIEIIVVDDGSQDGTGAVIDNYAAQYPEHVIAIHISNGGVTNARLTGVAQANGEWIGFVDGDDEIEPNMYERLLKNAQQHNAQISHCGYQMCFDDGRVHYFHNTGSLVLQDKATSLKDLLEGTMVEPGLCNKLFRKSLFNGILLSNVMDRSVKINEDLLMNFYLFSAAEKSVFEDWCPYHYIVRSSSASRSKLNAHRIYDPIRVKEQIVKVAEPEILPVARKVYLMTCIAVYNSIILSKQSDLEKDCCQIRRMIMNHAEWRSLLSRKQQLLANLIQYAPALYKLLYCFYSAHILKNPYE